MERVSLNKPVMAVSRGAASKTSNTKPPPEPSQLCGVCTALPTSQHRHLMGKEKKRGGGGEEKKRAILVY